MHDGMHHGTLPTTSTSTSFVQSIRGSVMAFEGFETTYTNTPSGARVFAYIRKGDAKLPVLVLMHGYAQNALKFKEFVKEIPPQWPLLVPDLPGYGNSTKPIDPFSGSLGHSKREWGKDIVSVVDILFGAGTKLIPYGHDRGGRVAYRLAFDFPDRVIGAAMLDIVPGIYVWDTMRLENNHHAETRKMHHWIFLSAPAPFPETMIASNPKYYYEYKILGCMGSAAKKDGDIPEWVRDCVEPYLDGEKGKARIAAACEDYRAGATHDVDDDIASSINPMEGKVPTGPGLLQQPLLILSGVHLRRRFDVDGIWKALAAPDKVTSYQIGDDTTGHYLVNERQEETGQRTREWLAQFESN